MAQIQLDTSIDMHNLSTWYGMVSSYNSSQITIVNGPYKGVYTGNFSYDSYGNVNGILTGYSQYYAGILQGAASGLSVPAGTAAQLIESNQIQTFFQIALSGDDQFTVSTGQDVIDGYGGYNTVTEPLVYATYAVSRSGSAVSIAGPSTQATLYNIQAIDFADGVYNVASGSFAPNLSAPQVLDMSSGQAVTSGWQTYSGPVAGLQEQFVRVTSDNLNVSTSTSGWFIHTGSGADAIAVSSGTNVLDGGTGSNFLTGGSGTDTSFVDDRGAPADIWSTVNNFHSGDAATIWGVTPQDFTLTWQDNQGAAGYTGLTLHATRAGAPTASLTLAGPGTPPAT